MRHRRVTALKIEPWYAMRATQRNFTSDAQAREMSDPGYELPVERVLIGQEEFRIIERAIRKMPAKRRQCFR